MAKVVACIAMKGGSGKSTLARHGSVILPRCGLLDLDPQQTSKRWIEKRKAAGIVGPALVLATHDQVKKVVTKGEGKVDWIIIDTPPSHDDTRSIRAAADVANYILIAIKPSPDDLDALGGTLDIVKGKRYAFVITMATRSNLLDRVKRTLESVGPVAPVIVGNRVAYPEAAEDGAAVTESDSNGAAAEEMRRLWTWIAQTV